MSEDRIEVGTCPKCSGEKLTCKYNLFERDELRIDSWEHKCLDCGFRETTAFRSDDEDLEVSETAICPFCGRKPASDE